MRKKIQDLILMQRIAGKEDPAIAYELLTSNQQFHKSEIEELKLMLIDNVEYAYKYAKANRLLGHWPLLDKAIQEALGASRGIQQRTPIEDMSAFIEMFIYAGTTQK